MGKRRGIRRLCRISAYFLAFYSAINANNNVKTLLILSFAILLIIFELIDKSLVTPVSISRNRFFAVFSSAFMARAFSGEWRVGAAIPLLL